MKIVEYKLVRYTITQFFNTSDEVNGLIKDGWQPIGGASVIKDRVNGQSYVHQAMVRYA